MVSVEDLYLKMFILSSIASVPKFIVSLISDYNPNHLFPTLKILGQDERFVQALGKTKDQFDKRHKLIVEKEKIVTPDDGGYGIEPEAEAK